MADVLVLDDDRQFCHMVSEHVQRAGHGVSFAHTLEEGLARVRSVSYDIVFLDIRLPDGSGLDILPELKMGVFPPEVIIITGYGDPEGTELALTHGAWDYLTKQSSVQKLVLSLSRALQYRRSRKGAARRTLFHSPELVGNSPGFRTALAVAAQAAGSDVSVLVTGETGTGKELCATAIHDNSPRSQGPFVVVDCAALPDSLVGSILFGHERGAFTGAHRPRVGLFKQADGGTLFLDEVGEMPAEIQRAFLRVLQERRFRAIGSESVQESNFRVISATNRNLERLAEEGAFRRDLLFRLRGLSVRLPPLRERREDISLLTTHFVNRQCRAMARDTIGVSEGFYEVLRAYDWPGNVRELAQAIASAIVQAGPDPVLYANHLPVHIRARVIQVAGDFPSQPPRECTASHLRAASPLDSAGDLLPLREMRGQFENAYLKELVKKAEGDIETACRISGLSRPHIYALLKKHGLRL